MKYKHNNNNLMKYLKTVFAAGIAIAMAGCSSHNDGPDGPVPSGNEDAFYSTITLKMPGTRAEGDVTNADKTDKVGEEVGKDYENKINTILLVMATKDETATDVDKQYKFITFALNDVSDNNSPNYKMIFQDKEKLFDQATKKVYIFAYCNPTQALVKKIAGTLNPATGKYEGGLAADAYFTDELCDANVSDTWNKNGFLMTSVEPCENTLPSQEELKKCNTEATAYSLGTIQVIRTAVRFDFRDASPEDTDPYTYLVKDQLDDSKTVAKIVLTRVAMFNQRKEFYMLPRVTSDGTNSTLCPGFSGMEGVHVVSPTAKTLDMQKPTSLDPATEHGTNPTLTWTSVTSIAEDDNTWNSDPTPTVTDPGDYHIWTYTTENTWDYIATETGSKVIPEASLTDDIMDKTTGFVFEAEIVPESANIPADANWTSGDTMYGFNNRLYYNANEVKKAADAAPNSLLAQAYKNAFTEVDGTVTPKSDAEVTTQGFTIYKAVEVNGEKKYYCYYFAYNYHNNDGNITTVSDMEFATVRNNVYKLGVSNIKMVGTFTPPSVLDWDVYFSLDIEVKPWVIRVNNYEF